MNSIELLNSENCFNEIRRIGWAHESCMSLSFELHVGLRRPACAQERPARAQESCLRVNCMGSVELPCAQENCMNSGELLERVFVFRGILV